jgi:hypothetical protein
MHRLQPPSGIAAHDGNGRSAGDAPPLLPTAAVSRFRDSLVIGLIAMLAGCGGGAGPTAGVPSTGPAAAPSAFATRGPASSPMQAPTSSTAGLSTQKSTVSTAAPSASAAPAIALEDLGALSSGVTYTSNVFEPHITFRLATRDNLLDTVGTNPDWCSPTNMAGTPLGARGEPLMTSEGTIVLRHPKSCQDELRIIHPYAVDCGTPDAHPDATTLAAALLARPGMTAARDLGTLQTPGAVPPRLFLRVGRGRVIEIGPSDGADLADPDHCRLLPEPGSSDPAIQLCRGTSALLVLVDVLGELVVLWDASSLQRGGFSRKHLLEHIYDIAFD